MIKIVCLEKSHYLTTQLLNHFNNNQYSLITFDKLVDGLKYIHENSADLILIGNILKDYSCEISIEYLNNNGHIKNIPFINYSVDNKKSNFFKELTNNIETKLKGYKKLPFEPVAITPIEIESEIFKIRQNKIARDKLTTKLLKGVFTCPSIEDAMDKGCELLNENFDIVSVKITYKYNFKSVNYTKEYTKPDSNYLNSIKKENEILSFCLNVNIYDNSELELLNFLSSTLYEAYNLIIKFSENSLKAEKLNTLFRNYLPEKVIDDLIKRKSTKSLMTGEKREVAVLFSHIKNFDNLKQMFNAQETVNFLNKHFSGISTIIKRHGGEINKFIEDAVFAMIGAPLSFRDNEIRAIESGIEIINFVKKQNLNYRVGVGIHLGKAIIGNIGSEDNFDYTAIGDSVNLAARLESLCKYYNVDILVSDSVRDVVIRHETNISFRKIDTVMVKGKDKPTTIYSVEDINRYPSGFINNYNKGIKMFILANWFFALDYFLKCQKQIPEDKVVEIYIERCKTFLKAPPKEWKGAITLDFK